VEISLSQPSPGLARLVVHDHGPGLAPELRHHLFSRFFRAHGASHTSGMGLGLFISQQIVQLHGGTIKAKFPEEGGSRFVVTVPSAPSPDE
jgi:signal transduction histidine kinase